MKTSFVLDWSGYHLDMTRRTAVMGIVNVTPDSFSDGGRFLASDAAVAQGLELVAAGADIVDIGGESTRPYADPVSEQEELDRVLPVIEKLAPQIDVPISIDTTKSAVAEAALSAGAAMVNDISAMRLDPDIGRVAARHQVPMIVMHMLGTPRTMQVDPVYEDLMGDIRQFLKAAMDRCTAAGVSRDNIIIDPGIGFGKTVAHNLAIIGHLPALASLDAPILVGSSRKSFIRQLLKPADQPDITPDTDVVETGTQASVAAAVMNGAHMVRVHNVADTVATVRIIDAIRNANP